MKTLLERSWYRYWHPLTWLLYPLSLIFCLLVALRRSLYRLGVFSQRTFDVPVIVVGNITVGGSGKTPMVAWLASYLQSRGYKPGIISRGYGSNKLAQPKDVTPSCDAETAGDEPLLLAQKTDIPVVIFHDRVLACEHLLSNHQVDIVISDDGMQHYALARDIEIAIIDGVRGFGNGLCLPAGPLRETISRLNHVTITIANTAPHPLADTTMQLLGDEVVNLKTERRIGLHEFDGSEVNAVAAIGYPKRFFNDLGRYGIHTIEHPFPDHHRFVADDLIFDNDADTIMTEKDAMKCRAYADEKMWYRPVEASFDATFEQLLNRKLEKCIEQKHT